MLFLHCEILTFILESSLSKYTSDSKRKCKYQTWALTSCPAERWDVGILHVMVEGAAGDELVVNFFKVVHFKPFHYNLSIKYPFFSAKMSKTWFQQGGPGGGFISCTKEVPGPPICNKLTKKFDHLHWKCISSVAPYCISYSADSARSPSQNRRQM